MFPKLWLVTNCKNSHIVYIVIKLSTCPQKEEARESGGVLSEIKTHSIQSLQQHNERKLPEEFHL